METKFSTWVVCRTTRDNEARARRSGKRWKDEIQTAKLTRVRDWTLRGLGGLGRVLADVVIQNLRLDSGRLYQRLEPARIEA